MPLLFVVSGISLFYAVGKSGAGRFVKDKVLRLLVPLVVGMFTHCALQVYLERLTHGDFGGTFFQFIPYYFQGYYEGGNPAAGNFAMTGMHLWYLLWLFVFTLLLYPLMRWLLGRGKGVLAWLGNALSQPGAVLLLTVGHPRPAQMGHHLCTLTCDHPGPLRVPDPAVQRYARPLWPEVAAESPGSAAQAICSSRRLSRQEEQHGLAGRYPAGGEQPAGTAVLCRHAARVRCPGGLLAEMCLHRGGILVFFLPLLVIHMGLRPFTPRMYSWSDLVYYLCFFIIGALFVSDERFVRAILRDWWLALVLGVAAFLGLGAIVAMGVSENWFADPSLPGFYLWWVIATLDTWCWIVVMWFVGMRYLDFSAPWLRYAQEAIVPFYVFHQPAIVAISFYVVQWQTSVALKMLVIFFGSLAITLAIVELIRRIAPLRALFGMKAARAPSPASLGGANA